MPKELPNASTIDEYIENCPGNIQPKLRRLREIIRQAAPQAQEKISWGMATFALNGNLVHFSCEKNHIGFHPAPSAIVEFASRLADYHCSKGTVRLPHDRELDEQLITDIVRFRVNEQMLPKNEREQSQEKRRPRHEMPEDVRELLVQEGLQEHYELRPPYQRNDYIGWITRAKRQETRDKRINQMLDELRSGEAYMGMSYKAKMPKEEI